jgi:hypothetical protein
LAAPVTAGTGPEANSVVLDALAPPVVGAVEETDPGVVALAVGAAVVVVDVDTDAAGLDDEQPLRTTATAAVRAARTRGLAGRTACQSTSAPRRR